MLLWVVNAMSPQEIRDRIMGPSSNFRRRLIKYLESSHQGGLINGTVADRPKPCRGGGDSDWESDEEDVTDARAYQSPTHTFPKAPPAPCVGASCLPSCAQCKRSRRWNKRYEGEVDDLIVRSNLHTHYHSVVDRLAKEAKQDWKGVNRTKRRRLNSKPAVER
ncbi:hypothetical protein C8R46DRAFT_847072, partial [Mycena filopes]